MVWAGSSGAGPGLSGQYRIGSITKTFTAVLVMQARDAGMLALDDPIGATSATSGTPRPRSATC